jgi:two-component system, LytTR family, sensor histidine kinase AlgZ
MPPRTLAPPPSRPSDLLVLAARRSRWQRMLVLNVGGALVAFGIALGTDAPSWARVSRVLAMSVVYNSCVGTLAALVLPVVLRRSGARGLAADFAVRVVTLVFVIGAGLALGAVLFVLFGLIDPSELMAHAVPTHWPRFVYPTMLLVALGISYYLTMSDELDATSLALRTKERDEAVARQQAAEAQLSALEARVQPHFLFNTLNSIAALIPEDAEAAERMVERVAALMRSSLQHDGPSTASLGDELRLVRDYLEIERVRFRERLRYEVQVAADLEGVAVPRLSVQTLVENAVKYAVARQRGGATIVIGATAADGRASVSVSDDGPGFTDEGGQHGHGLRLLRARLQTLFGDQAALRIQSRPGATSCVIEVPLS